MNYYVLILTMLVITVSCRLETDTSQTKSQSYRDNPIKEMRDILEASAKAKRFLTYKIFEPSWAISFYLDPQCGFNRKHAEEIGNAIITLLFAWIEAFGTPGDMVKVENESGGEEWKIIVKNFFINRVDPRDYKIESFTSSNPNHYSGDRAQRKNTVKKIEKPVFMAYFYCGRINPLTGKLGKGAGLVHHPDDMDKELEVHIYLPANREEIIKSKFYLGDTGIGLNAMSHEFGHLFSLDDTRYDKEKDDAFRQAFRNNGIKDEDMAKSDGKRNIDHRDHTKLQPPSVMSHYETDGKIKGFPGLFPDDIEGVDGEIRKIFKIVE